MNVLIVDDNSDIADIFSELVSVLGHEVRTANSGEAALAQLQRRAADVVFLDLGLPDIDGYQVANTIHTRYGDTVRVVAVTGVSRSTAYERAKSAGIDDVLVKPVRREQIEAALAAPPKSSPEPVTRTAGSLLVLVVERDPHIRELEAHFLKEAGYSIQFAADGHQALELARKLLPDVIITEILVPKLDGLALCRQIKADPATSNIAVLVFSILAAGSRAQEAGADAFLIKPLAERRLVSTVQTLLNARSRLKKQA